MPDPCCGLMQSGGEIDGAPGQAEPRWLGANVPEPPSKIVALYDRRRPIEEPRRDTKGSHFEAQVEWPNFGRQRTWPASCCRADRLAAMDCSPTSHSRDHTWHALAVQGQGVAPLTALDRDLVFVAESAGSRLRGPIPPQASAPALPAPLHAAASGGGGAVNTRSDRAKSAIDNHAQSCYKIHGPPRGVRQSGDDGCLAGMPGAG
jgi:hypothetical protein